MVKKLLLHHWICDVEQFLVICQVVANSIWKVLIGRILFARRKSSFGTFCTHYAKTIFGECSPAISPYKILVNLVNAYVLQKPVLNDDLHPQFQEYRRIIASQYTVVRSLTVRVARRKSGPVVELVL